MQSGLWSTKPCCALPPVNSDEQVWELSQDLGHQVQLAAHAPRQQVTAGGYGSLGTRRTTRMSHTCGKPSAMPRPRLQIPSGLRLRTLSGPLSPPNLPTPPIGRWWPKSGRIRPHRATLGDSAARVGRRRANTPSWSTSQHFRKCRCFCPAAPPMSRKLASIFRALACDTHRAPRDDLFNIDCASSGGSRMEGVGLLCGDPAPLSRPPHHHHHLRHPQVDPLQATAPALVRRNARPRPSNRSGGTHPAEARMR